MRPRFQIVSLVLIVCQLFSSLSIAQPEPQIEAELFQQDPEYLASQIDQLSQKLSLLDKQIEAGRLILNDSSRSVLHNLGVIGAYSYGVIGTLFLLTQPLSSKSAVEAALKAASGAESKEEFIALIQNLKNQTSSQIHLYGMLTASVFLISLLGAIKAVSSEKKYLQVVELTSEEQEMLKKASARLAAQIEVYKRAFEEVSSGSALIE